MKTAIRQLRRFMNYAPYPNAATPSQALHKFLDTLLVAMSGAGLAAILLLVLAFF